MNYPPQQLLSMTATPLLTICIPTYNRAKHLEKLLAVLVEVVFPMGKMDVEVLVVNNCSTDGTKEILDGTAHPSIRVFHREKFLLTAEENIIHSLGHCRGEFVWFLGDDDVPVISNFADHLDRLRNGGCDYYVFNPALVDSSGTLFSLQTIRMNRDIFVGSMIDLVLLTDCLFTFAGISNHIVRRSLLSTERGIYYLNASRIYSMVAWMIEAGSNKAKVALVNRPLVYYRENDYSGGHWPRVAERMRVGDFYFWSMGLVELFSCLIESGGMTHHQFGMVIDVARDGRRYRLLDDMIYKTFEQIKKGRKSLDARQRLTTEQMRKLADFCMKADPLSFDLIQVLIEMNALTAPANSGWGYLFGARFHGLTRKFHGLFKARQGVGQWVCRVQQIYCGYEILWTPIQYIAVHGGGSTNLRESVLKCLDPLPQAPLVFVGATREVVLKKIDAYVARVDATDAHTAAQQEPTNLAPEKMAWAQQELVAVYNSISWRITYPLRAVKSNIWRLLGLK